LTELLRDASNLKTGAIVFAYFVNDPWRYGVLEFDKDFRVKSISEKPKSPKSNWVVTGIYFYDNKVIDIAKSLKPSKRNELEISDINNVYLKRGQLKVKFLGRGYAWLDTGTHDSLIDASIFVKTIEERQGLKIGCIEEVAYKMGFITKRDLEKLARGDHTSYGAYLKRIVTDAQ